MGGYSNLGCICAQSGGDGDLFYPQVKNLRAIYGGQPVDPGVGGGPVRSPGLPAGMWFRFTER